ncbi:class I SAM-dependent methyltransferase [Candidatus Microgenomates bacterium]|nr:MAG: class I SAM-dependent methyltransferase [Candidatus Microgenomates bacterium]
MKQDEIVERLDPDSIHAPEINYEHLHRYFFARNLVKNKTLLDLGCGDGYGAMILARRAKKVTGIDIDKKTIDKASKKYRAANIDFKVIPAQKINTLKKTFDIVTAFELIEHLSQDDQQKCIEQIKSVLKTDGLLLISTPIKEEFMGINNPFHLHEFENREFKDFIQNSFHHCVFFGQRIYCGSVIWNLHSSSESEKQTKINEVLIHKGPHRFQEASDRNKRAMFTIALCSDSEINIPEDSACFDISNELLISRVRQIKSLKMVLSAKDLDMNNAQKSLEAMRIEREKTEVYAKDLELNLEKSKTEFKKVQVYVKSLEEVLKKKDEHLQRLVGPNLKK